MGHGLPESAKPASQASVSSASTATSQSDTSSAARHRVAMKYGASISSIQ